MLGCAASGGGADAAGTELAMKECSPDMLLLLCSRTRSSRVEVVIRPQMVVFLGHTVAELARAPGWYGRLRQGNCCLATRNVLFPA
jgi:hypothetical protein